jgi:uncharacterized OB-fold protein
VTAETAHEAPPPRPVPLPDDASESFWAACARHELVIQRCADCERFRFPPRPMCPSCGSMQWRDEPASGRGRVWSWVIAHPPVLPAFRDRVPYNVVVVELEEGVRMIGNAVECANEDLHEGMAVEVAWDDVEDGVAIPVWRPT